MAFIMQDNTGVGDIVYPEAVPYTYDTLGWKIVFAVLLIDLIIFVVYEIRKYQKNAYRRAAIKYMKQLEATYAGNEAKVIVEGNALMKQIALRFVDRQEVALLDKQDWIDFLNQHTPKLNLFTYEDIPMIEGALYQSSHVEISSAQYQHFTESTKKWINHHGF